MKFILNEKYILREKLILTEADEDFIKALAAFDAGYEKNIKTFQEVKEKLSTLTAENTAYTNDQLLNKIEQVNKNISADSLGDIEILKSSVREATDAAKDWVQSVLDKTKKNATIAQEFPQLNNVIDRLSDYTVPGKNDKARDLDVDEKNIKEHWKAFYSKIIMLLSVTPTTNSKEITDLITNLEQIINSKTLQELNSAENIKIKDKALVNAITKLVSDFDILNTAIAELSSKFDTDSKSLTSDDFNNTINKEKSVLSDITTIEDGKTMSAVGQQVKKGSQTNDTTNWKAELNMAGTEEEKRAVWLRFYEKTFGKEYVEQIRKINTGTNAFASECLEMGFGENDNPFIYFLKNNKSILMSLNQFSYGALHNAFARDYISDATLRGKGKLGTNNVIFNKSLYRDHSEELLDYLKLQKQALQHFRSSKFITGTLKNRYNNQIDFISDLFYKPGNTLAVDRKAGNIKNELKTLIQIRKELEACFNVSIGSDSKVKEQEQLTNAALKVVLAKLKKNKGDSITAVLYAYEKLRNAQNVKGLSAILNRYPEIASASLQPTDVQAIEKAGRLLDGYQLKATDFETFVDAVAKAAGIAGGK